VDEHRKHTVTGFFNTLSCRGADMTDTQAVTITYTDLGGNTSRRSVEIRSADDERFEAICHKGSDIALYGLCASLLLNI
jgi:hypothetical protein